MTQEEMRRLIDELSRPVAEPFPSQMYAQPVQQSKGFEPGAYSMSIDEYMAERSWIKKMFTEWATAQVSTHKEPTELAAGDTSQLDDFLGGFAKLEAKP